MLSPASPLLDEPSATDSFNPGQETNFSPVPPRQQGSIRKRLSMASLIFNISVIIALVYGAGICISTIQNRLMPTNQYCFHSVDTSYNYLTFSAAGYGSFYGPRCQNYLRIISTYASGKTFCSGTDVDAGFDIIRRECEDGGFGFPDLDQILADVTDEKIREMRVVEFGEIQSTENVTEPVVISRPFFKRVDDTITTWEFELHSHHGAGFALYAFWMVVLTVAALNHVSRFFYAPDTTTGDIEGGLSGSIIMCRRWCQTNIVIPPTFGSYHKRLLLWSTIPTRLESIVVGSFYLFTTLLCLANYRTIPDNIYWSDPSQQFWRYVADRTGVMSYATLPLIWIFAGRNNVFMWATGLSYQTFNIYHRHIARVGTILAIVHSVVYTWLYVKFEGLELYRKELVELWFFLGIVATICMSLLLVFSHAWLRIKFYETFLILHIALSVVALVCCFVHTSIFRGQYDAYLWPLVVIWFLDRGLRLIRLVLCNVRVKFSGNVISRARTVASYSKDSDVIRIDITTDSVLAQPAAGQFYYIYQPTTLQGYENHPFTLGAWSSQLAFSDSNGSPLLSRSKTHEDYEDEIAGMVDSEEHVQPSKKGNTLTFWVRPYDGWTKRLRDGCLRSPDHAIRPLMLLEGPYGHHADLCNFEDVLLIAGGTGIASAVPYILEHTSSAKTNDTRTRNIHLIWTARQAAFVQEVMDRELLSASRRNDFQTSLFYTRFGSLPQRRDSSGSEMESSSGSMQTPEIQNGRPDIRTAIRKAAHRAQITGTRVAVLVCGPAGMADEARIAVHGVLREGCHCVEYFEESFGW